MTRILLGLLTAGFIVISAARIAYSVTADTGTRPINKAWAQDTMGFVAWNNEKWTARIHGDEFNLVPQNQTDWSRHSNASIAFTDWNGVARQAKIDGDMFLLVDQGHWHGPVERSEAIRFRDWDGNNQLRTVIELQR